jgi:hypothetical protein
MKATARLNALSKLMDYYSDRAIKYMNYDSIRNEATEKYEAYKDEIEKILQGKS